MTDDLRHGVRSTYTHGLCRCTECRAANTAWQQERKAVRRRMLEEDPTIVSHGLASTYGNWGCRCDECSAAHSASMKMKREKMKRKTT